MPSTLVSKTALDHLAARVTSAPLIAEPFAHIQVVDVFPADVYRRMVEQLPQAALYEELHHKDALLPDGRSARLRFELTPANVARLSARQRAFWADFVEELQSDRMERVFKSIFKASIETRFGRPAGEVRVHQRAVLFRDIGGYKISIHPDSEDKVITSQFYLPGDASQSHLGTAFHRRRPDGTFEKVKRLPFLPNSGYAFAVTGDSWHSVEQITAADRDRNTLMLIYYQQRRFEKLRTLFKRKTRS